MGQFGLNLAFFAKNAILTSKSAANQELEGFFGVFHRNYQIWLSKIGQFGLNLARLSIFCVFWL